MEVEDVNLVDYVKVKERSKRVVMIGNVPIGASGHPGHNAALHVVRVRGHDRGHVTGLISV